MFGYYTAPYLYSDDYFRTFRTVNLPVNNENGHWIEYSIFWNRNDVVFTTPKDFTSKYFHYSLDQGKSWSGKVILPGSLESIFAISETRYLVMTNFELFETSDYGATLSKITKFNLPEFSNPKFLVRFWITGENQILQFLYSYKESFSVEPFETDLYISEDRGANWVFNKKFKGKLTGKSYDGDKILFYLDSEIDQIFVVDKKFNTWDPINLPVVEKQRVISSNYAPLPPLCAFYVL